MTARLLFLDGVNTYRLTEGELLTRAQDFGVPLVIGVSHAYPPSTLLLFFPFTWLPYEPSRVVWVLLAELGLILAMGVPLWLARARHPWWYAFVPFLVLQFFPSQAALFTGQPLTMMVGLYVLGLVALQRQRPLLGGCLLGLGNVFKPQFHLIWLYLLYRRQWGACAAGLGVAAAIEGLAFLRVGAPTYVAWRGQAHGQSFDTGSEFYNYSLLPLLARIFSIPEVHPALLGVLAVLILLAGLLAWRVLRYARLAFPEELPYGVSLMLIGTLLVFPAVTDHHLVLLLIPLLLTWAHLPTHSSSSSIIMFLLCFLVLGVRHALTRFELFATGPLAVLTGDKTVGIILLVVLVIRQLRDRTHPNTL